MVRALELKLDASQSLGVDMQHCSGEIKPTSAVSFFGSGHSEHAEELALSTTVKRQLLLLNSEPVVLAGWYIVSGPLEVKHYHKERNLDQMAGLVSEWGKDEASKSLV